MKVSNLEIPNQEHYQNLTLSKIDSVSSHYTKVPNHILRRASFGDPMQFMIYLFLFSFSHGFSKNHCELSQEQIMKFTGASRNTVKRALDALIAQDLIKVIGEYTCKRKARRYEVTIPSSHDGGKLLPKRNAPEPEHHPVKNGQCANLTVTRSKSDRETVSNFDTIKESIKNKLKNSLSGELETYFESLPKKKHDREQKALEGLLEKFPLEEIQKAFDQVKQHGEPRTGNPVHSPMAFLAMAMPEVQGKVAELEKKKLAAESLRKSSCLRDESESRQAALAQTQQEAAQNAFAHAFPCGIEQGAFLENYLARNPFAKKVPAHIARAQAIWEWFGGLRSA